MSDDKIYKVDPPVPWPAPPPARRATDRQGAPTGEGTVVLHEVLGRLEDMIRIREAAFTPAPNIEVRERSLRRVCDDLEQRAEMGKAKYGTYLRVNNGRSAVLDLYQECLDAVMYSAQGLLEGDRRCTFFFHTAVALAEQVAQHLEELNGKCNTGNGHAGNR